MNSRIASLAVLSAATVLATSLPAAVIINLNGGVLRTASGAPMPDGGLILLVASTTDSEFSAPSPTSSTAVGSTLANDDVIVGAFAVSSATSALNGGYNSQVTKSYAGNLDAGDPLQLYWFPTLTTSSAVIGENVSYGAYRTSAITSGSDIAWQLPADGTTVLLSFKTTSAGGTLADSFGTATLITAGSSVVAPGITAQPTNQIVTAGASASFTVTASGTDLSYQWRKDGANIAGANTATYTIGTTSASHAGSYTVVVSNTASSVTSAAATLTVVPVFTAPAPHGFAASTTGGGSTTQTLVTTAADFRAQAESAATAVITVSGTLNLGGKVSVKSNKTIQGLDANATLVGNLELASGVNNVVIRGLNITNPGTSGGDGITLSGASSVFISNVTFFDCADTLLRIVAGADNVTVSWCEFYYTAGQTNHRYATLIGAASGETKPLHVTLANNWWSSLVDQQMPASTFGHVHAVNNLFKVGATANTSGSSALTGAQFLSERNQYTNIVSPLAKSAGGLIRAIDNVYTTGTADAGTDTIFTPSYSYRLLNAADVTSIIEAGAGNTEGAASPTLAPATASITASGTAITAGSSFTLTAATTSSGFNAGYQWRLNNAAIDGATGATYTVSNAQSAHAGIYTVLLSNASGEGIVSTPATIAVNAAPVTPTTPSAQSGGGASGGGGGGGGGAPSTWFFLALGALAGLRRLMKRP